MQYVDGHLACQGAIFNRAHSAQDACRIAAAVGIPSSFDGNVATILEVSGADRIRWFLYNTDSGLYLLGSLMLEGESLEGDWSDWSEAAEIKRAKLQQALIRKWRLSGTGIEVYNGYDPKGGFSAISIRFV